MRGERDGRPRPPPWIRYRNSFTISLGTRTSTTTAREGVEQPHSRDLVVEARSEGAHPPDLVATFDARNLEEAVGILVDGAFELVVLDDVVRAKNDAARLQVEQGLHRVVQRSTHCCTDVVEQDGNRFLLTHGWPPSRDPRERGHGGKGPSRRGRTLRC
jgi:hypothetical protein